MTENLLFYLLILINLVLAVGLVWLMVNYRQVLLRLRQSRKETRRWQETQKLLDEVADEIENQAQVFLGSQEKDAQRIFKTISEAVKEKMLTLVSDFEGKLGEEAASFQEKFNQRLETEFAKVSADLESYRGHQMEKIDAEVRQLIIDITREVLGEALDTATQEKLVLKALEKIK